MTIILHNPLSKNKKSKRVTKKLVDYYKKNNLPFRVKSLLKIKDLEAYLTGKPDDNNIIILGGDGTINTFINDTFNYNIKQPLYLKKSGSGNDFLRSLKKQKTNHQYILKLVHNGKTRYFINGAGMGIDGEIGYRVNQSKNKRKLNYLINTVKSLISFKPKFLEITIDGAPYTFKKAYLVNANNGKFIGGGMKLTPKAQIDEPNFDVLIVHRGNKFLLLLIFLSVYLGLHTYVKRYVFTTKAKHIKATMFSKQIAQCDGECFLDTQEIEVSVTDKKVYFTPYHK
ncbi:diacylglycerol/lipid kinase family protein [Liberiplasma polymorphum]|uniref:diacylglycerol/lipid kinase family protein n=1 Tax=Liberiplasma polymorphum TaxID=3374570 RepID=UPI003775A182